MNKLLRLPAKRLLKFVYSTSLASASKWVMEDYTWAGRPVRGMADAPGFTTAGSDPIEVTPSIDFMPIAWSAQMLAMNYGTTVADFFANYSLLPYTGKFAKPGTAITPPKVILTCPGRSGLQRENLIDVYLAPMASQITAAGILIAEINPSDLLDSAPSELTSPIIKMVLPHSDAQLNGEGVGYQLVDEGHWVAGQVLHLDFVSDYEFQYADGRKLQSHPYTKRDLTSGDISEAPDVQAKHVELVKRCYPRYEKYGYFCPYYKDPNVAYSSFYAGLQGSATVSAFAAELAAYGVECPIIDPYDEAAVGAAFRAKVTSFFGL